jgi:hypothetical protein
MGEFWRSASTSALVRVTRSTEMIYDLAVWPTFHVTTLSTTLSLDATSRYDVFVEEQALGEFNGGGASGRDESGDRPTVAAEVARVRNDDEFLATVKRIVERDWEILDRLAQ